MMEKRKKAATIKDGQKRILAMKDGVEGYFSEMSWEVGKPERHGWMKVGVKSAAVEVETEEIKVSEIPEGDDIYPTDDEIKTFLKENGIKFHHATGTKKLRGLYDENKK